MAEYNIAYDELKTYVEECMEKSENASDLAGYKVEVLSALTLSENSQSHSEVQDMVSLWQNQIGTPSELLLGTRYIRIKDGMVAFLELMCCSGLLDAYISVKVIDLMSTL